MRVMIVIFLMLLFGVIVRKFDLKVIKVIDFGEFERVLQTEIEEINLRFRLAQKLCYELPNNFGKKIEICLNSMKIFLNLHHLNLENDQLAQSVSHLQISHL